MVNWEFIANLDFSVVWEYRGPLLKGFLRTLSFWAAAVGIGLVLSVIVAGISQMKFAPTRWLVAAYVEVVRNTPFPVQLFWIHFALPAATGLNLSVSHSAIIALVISNVGYATEIVRAGIEAVPKGQWEASNALAIPRRIVWTRVILPQAFRIALPALINNTLSVFKMTAILSILAVNELMLVTQRLATHTGRPIELYTSAAALYFVVGVAFVFAIVYVDRWLTRSEA